MSAEIERVAEKPDAKAARDDAEAARRSSGVVARAVRTFCFGFAGIAFLAWLARATGEPFLIPPLGASAFLFFASPQLHASSPRNAMLGTVAAILCGYGALWVTGLCDAPSALATGVGGDRILATALALASTSAVMVLLDTAHPPAGATTLVISLGLITRPSHLGVVALSVAVLAALALVLHRANGTAYPIWAHAAAPPRDPAR